MFENYPDVVDVKDLCTMLKISKKKVYELLKNDSLNYLKIGRIYRIPKQSVIQFITSDNSTTMKGDSL